MAGTYLIDTNAAIARLNGDDTIIDLLRQADEVFIPSIVLGELYYGAEKSAKVNENIAAIDRLTEVIVVLACEVDIARVYGRIKNQLRQAGHPIPENDIWIGAIAVHYNLTLLTRDEHFSHISGLVTANWS
jgi:tRNA(fMet)-specific endonuclease VapC